MNPLRIFQKHSPPPTGGNIMSETAPELPKTVPVDASRISEWNNTLRRYKNARSTVEQKIKNNERFWRMRQWKEGSNDGKQMIPSTAWLFTCIQSKLADVVEQYPRANFRPRQKDDVTEAKRLSSIVPVVVAQNNFEMTYKNVAEYTLKNGIGVYRTWWDGTKHGGIGDVAITEQDVLSIFWEPGVTDLQKSSYVFTVEIVDINALRARYPNEAGAIKGKVIDVAKFVTDERVDTHDKVVVVDVYYKVNGILHYAKFADTVCLESTENNPEMYPNGLYAHGKYPFVIQNLYHIEQSLYGTGMVDIGADTQLQIDLMNEAIVENTLMGAKPRYFSQIGSNFNENDLLDWRKSIVPCSSISETTLRQIESKPLQGNYLDFLNMKTEELKYVTSNHDVNNGVAPSGITAASALASLQESSGKSSRMIIKSFYNAFSEVMELVLELIREFYDTQRWFRIVPDEVGAEEQFVPYDNTYIKGVPQGMVNGMDGGLRIPEFDIEITAEKANPYKKMEMNELALSFFKMGFFNPQMADQAIACLSMMDFDDRDNVIEKIKQNQTLLDMLMMYQQMAMTLAQKYGDAQAMALIQQNMAMMGQQMPPMGAGGAVDIKEAANPGKSTGEIKQVEDARARARQTTEVS